MNNKIPNNPNVKVIKSVESGLFTNYIFKTIPLVFDESLSYYETLLGLLNYLKNTIIPTVNNNADAVAELQALYEQLRSYVDNYFKNLDVQQEINNKLDEMVSDGTFENILLNYSNVTKVYDTYQDLLNDTTLVSNMKIQTLGYYEIGDNGGANYITSNELNPNAYVEQVNNVYVELVTSQYNIKMFGAKGDDINDDTQAFKNAIQTVGINNTLYIPKGVYKITDTLIIPDTLTIKGINSVPKIKYYGENILFKIIGHDANIEDTHTTVISEEKKPILSQLILWCNGVFDSNFYGVAGTTGIMYDNTIGKTNARTYLENLNIEHFDTAISYSNLNSYILSFDKCSFTRNNIALLFPQNQTNSGERISYNDGIFDSNKIVAKFLGHGYDLHFNNCSIDYNLCFIHAMSNVGSRMIDINGCHYETKYTGDDNIPHGIVWGALISSQINISNSMILTKVSEKQFNSNNLPYKYHLTIEGSQILYWDEDYYKYDLNHLFFTNTNLIVQANNNFYGYAGMGLPLSFTQSLTLNPAFNTLKSGNATKNLNNELVDSDNKISGYTITADTNVNTYQILDANTITNYKSLKAIPNDTSTETIVNIRNDEYIEYKSLNCFAIVVKNVSTFRFRTLYYDENKTRIRSDDYTIVDLSNSQNDTLCIVPRSYRANKPFELQNVKYVRYELQFRNGSKTTFPPELNCFMPYTL